MPKYLAVVQVKATCSVPVEAEDDDDLDQKVKAMSIKALLKHSDIGLRSNLMWHTQKGL